MDMSKLQPRQGLMERLLTTQASHGAEYERSDVENLIHGLINLLPELGSIWPLDDRAKWLRLAASIFDVSYKPGDDGEREEISIVPARSERLQKESEVGLPLSERQLRRLKEIRERNQNRADPLPNAAVHLPGWLVPYVSNAARNSKIES